MRTLVIDTATAACSVALIEGGVVIARSEDHVGRGHAEKLVPMIAALPGGGRARHILVDVGPGSFTGIRVGIAAARGLALGWNASVAGYSSLALVAAAALSDDPAGPLAAVLEGGHGEVFMQVFAAPLAALGPLESLPPAVARMRIAHMRAVGDGLRWLHEDDPRAAPVGALPRATDALLLPPDLAQLPPRPLYGRAPDAKPPPTRSAR
ncbi:tRNA (adenosine(37)-N6)-threonylcarbamoyltransferase complex dimerization subunit type 1 TsaB [Sphingomonas sp.]|uniref:tRNA (adenosine(37)-N6)-threonylcarbamoyltransferase complex dimerization subunit type 1 TsaB n=1 Tax=Sphingomonas sp. TaxID=28214 RepID=UPI002D7EB799|nr:tRNA (adenosine(37)-N6)-threonylcarbamoyltransferase complex dimerization subunit type 1 TsaB [Sphingomonas sp.]HEU0043009.1 tRNA (adenosine(37)-N6)-threonylcarbamoyltransferase complex dimerization subunit type 1 TsaB [Sphingomonas sp.]